MSGGTPSGSFSLFLKRLLLTCWVCVQDVVLDISGMVCVQEVILGHLGFGFLLIHGYSLCFYSPRLSMAMIGTIFWHSSESGICCSLNNDSSENMVLGRKTLKS